MSNLIETWGFGIPPHYASTAYDPSTFFIGGTKGPWYDPNNTANTLNGSGTPSTNGQVVATLNDSGTAGINATQSTDANRPTLSTNYANSRSALNIDLTDYFDCSGMNTFTSAANSVTVLVVYSPTDASTNHIMFRQYDNPFSNERLRAGWAGDKPRLLFNLDAGSYGNDRIGAAALTTPANHALIYVFDPQHGMDGVYVDNASYLAFGAAGGTTASAAFDATDANQSRFFLNCLGNALDIYIHKNAIMSSQQRTDYFAAVKSRFALTTY